MSDGLVRAKTVFETISVIVTTIVVLGGLAIAIVMWVTSAQSKPEAAKQYEALRTEFQAADVLIDRKVENTTKAMEPIGRDVRTIKCLLTKAKAKEREKCGFEQ